MKITKDTTIREIVTNPLFESYGHLLLPVDLPFSMEETIADITKSSHYIWYSNLHVETSLEVLHFLFNERQHGKQIFYPIYSQKEVRKDRSKADTGLFLFRGKPDSPFAVVNAGGGFQYVAALHDSFPQALAISQAGYNAFALIYRPQAAYEDLGRALDYIYIHADELGVSKGNYSLWGGSAGARMAITLGNQKGLSRYTRSGISQASAVISQYTGYSAASSQDAPTFANCGTNDSIANWRVMEKRMTNLSQLGITSEFHVYRGLRHGFGIGKDTQAEGWGAQAITFWEQQMNGTRSRRK